MADRSVRRWPVRFQDLEPNLDDFARRFTSDLEQHPVTGGWGRWLNPLGRWDWWDLGGRFDGRIAGERRRPGRTASPVSSGPNTGRALVTGIEDALGRALGQDRPAEVVVEADNNVEMVSRLLEDARAGLPHAIPGAVLLPPGSAPDRLRWVSSWPEVGPSDSLGWLGLPETADWRSVVVAAYERYPEHWAAGVAYHF